MLGYAPAEIIGNADIKRAVTLARQDVDVKAIRSRDKAASRTFSAGSRVSLRSPGTRSPKLRRRRLVQSLAHFLAGLEERHRLLRHRDMGAGARITPGAGRP